MRWPVTRDGVEQVEVDAGRRAAQPLRRQRPHPFRLAPGVGRGGEQPIRTPDAAEQMAAQHAAPLLRQLGEGHERRTPTTARRQHGARRHERPDGVQQRHPLAAEHACEPPGVHPHRGQRAGLEGKAEVDRAGDGELAFEIAAARDDGEAQTARPGRAREGECVATVPLAVDVGKREQDGGRRGGFDGAHRDGRSPAGGKGRGLLSAGRAPC